MSDPSAFAPTVTTTRARITLNAVHMAELVRRGLLIADAAAVADIEDGSFVMVVNNVQWLDVRPMLDEREHSPTVIDMAIEVLTYAEQRGLIERHQVDAHMVRIRRQG